MEPIKEFMAKKMVGEKLHFKCDCLFQFDQVGQVVDYMIEGDEIIFIVSVDDKIIKIGSNHPNMAVETI